MIRLFYLDRAAYFLLLVLLLIITAPLNSQSKLDFAKHLMQEKDYFRAITTYKELSFFSKNTDSLIYFYSQIGKAYRLSKKYDLSVATYSSILDRYPTTQSVKNNIYINIGLNYLGLSNAFQAETFLKSIKDSDTSGLALFYLGLARCELGIWDDAVGYYIGLSNQKPGSYIGNLSNEFAGRLAQSDQIPRRNPTTALVLSSIIPGSGQLYCEHYFDAAQAFAYVASFAFASYMTYKYDQNYNRNYWLTGISVSITSLFHLANIIGAERTATYFNQRQKEIFLQDIREKSLEIDF